MSRLDILQKVKGFKLGSAPGHLLRRNHQRSVDLFADRVGIDVTRQQVGVLISLCQNPGSSQRDLVDETGIDKSTLKEMLGRMEKKGWIQRTRADSDNRAWCLNITTQGEDLLIERIAQIEAVQSAILSPLLPAEQDLFIKFLRKLIGRS